MEILIGIIGIMLGFLLMIYRVPVRRFMGQIGWAERYFGPGGTYTGLLLIGLGLCFFSLMIATSTLNFLLGPIDTLFGAFKK